MCSSVVVYVPYAFSVEISAPLLRDPKGSGPSKSCDVDCAVSHPSFMSDINVSNHS